MLAKLTPGLNFINVLRTAFTLIDPKSVKNTVKSKVSFYTFGIYGRKSCLLNIGEIDTWMPPSYNKNLTMEGNFLNNLKSGE